MFAFHGDRKNYFDIQAANAAAYVIPFIEERVSITPGMRVLEIGCGEGGVMKAFVQRGCTCVGVELDAQRITWGSEWLSEELTKDQIRFVAKDIYATSTEELGGPFDIIVLKDVIEHIHDQPAMISRLKELLVHNGIVYFGFPPWQMPFGGHQQICKNKWLSRLPYYHLLPGFIYKGILNAFGENVAEMMEIRSTGISIERFESICKQAGYELLHQRHYMVNPIYQWKFGWKPRVQWKFIQGIPYLRNFVTTCVYYIIRPKYQL